MRGVIVNRDRSLQVNDFSGILLPGGITPTDIDGALEVGGRLFVFFEMKSCGTPIKHGQRLFLERVVDSLQRDYSPDDRTALAFICDHQTPVGQDVNAKETWVREYRYMEKWRVPQEPIMLGAAVAKIYDSVFADPF